MLKEKEMDYLPPEVWVDIFLRLPIKTLLRCICVCISWQKTIQDPSFINSHLQIQRRDLMLVRTYAEKSSEEKEDGNKKETYTIYYDDETFSVYRKLDFPFTRPFSPSYSIIGNCNGVLCITSGRLSMDDTNLWNPSIRKSIELPPPRITFMLHGDFEQEIGFGYDARMNDYKVVRIVQLSTNGFSNWIPLEVDLYSVSTGVWRNISHLASDIKCHVFYWAPQAYIHETAHWVAKCSTTRRQVVSFDFGQEVFRCFDIPTGISCQNSYWPEDPGSILWPSIVQGSLSLVERCANKYIVWMMKKYGDSSSWTKWLNINSRNDYSVKRLIGFRKKSEVLLQIDENLCSFDHNKAQGKDLNILRRSELKFWNLLQQDHRIPQNWFGQHIYNYDPNAAPKDLGIQSDTSKIYCEGYIESLVLIGKSTVRHVDDECQSKEECMKSSIDIISD